MSTPYVGEIRMFAGNFAPNGWAFCQGQIIAISQNDTLFTLIGTTYGGDGQQTFQLPNLAGRVAIHQGPGFVIGQLSGTESVTLTTQQIPSHTHSMAASNASPTGPNNPSGQFFAKPVGNIYDSAPVAGSMVGMNAGAVSLTGGSQPHDNMVPFLCISFIISLFGVFPTQS